MRLTAWLIAWSGIGVLASILVAYTYTAADAHGGVTGR